MSNGYLISNHTGHIVLYTGVLRWLGEYEPRSQMDTLEMGAS